MVCEISRSWFQSIAFMINLRNAIKARSMVWMMVYDKMAKLKNAGDKSVGEVSVILRQRHIFRVLLSVIYLQREVNPFLEYPGM